MSNCLPLQNSLIQILMQKQCGATAADECDESRNPLLGASSQKEESDGSVASRVKFVQSFGKPLGQTFASEEHLLTVAARKALRSWLLG